MTSLACQLILRVFNCFTYIPLSSYRWILFKISHAICRIFFCSLLHTIYEVDEDHDHWTSFLSVYPDNNSGRCFSLISKIIISHLVYMELWELVLYLGKDECKHSTACWGEAACCIFSLRCWISSSVPHRNIFINCISDSWVFFQAILRRLSLQGSKIQWDADAAHSWQDDKPTHYSL